MTTNWEKFKLLMWKNWLLSTRHKYPLLIELLVPLVFSGVLVMIRTLVHPTEIHTITRYPQMDTAAYLNSFKIELTKLPIRERVPFERFRLAYSPDNAENTAKITEVNKLLGLTLPPVGYSTNALMHNALYESTFLAGIEMNKIDATHLEFAIRFPGMSRFGKEVAIIRNWNTGLQFPRSQYAGPRNPRETFGGSPAGYVEEGFIAIQMALYKVFFCKPEMPKMFLQRFPYPKYTADTLLSGMEHLISLMIMLSFVYPAVNTVKFITQEKEHQLKEAMKIVGVANWLQWCAWFVRSMICQLISSVLIIIMLTFSWQGNGVSVFTYSSFMPLLVYMIVYNIATTAFCFMISVFFSKASTASAVAGLLWFMTYSVFTFTSVSYAVLPLYLKMLLSLFSNAGMAFGFQIIVLLEQSAMGLHWNNLSRPVSSDDVMTVAHCIASLLMATVLYLLVTFYVERVFPGDYGIPEKWYYPFTKHFWCGDREVTGKLANVAYIENKNRDRFETEPSSKETGIEICSLRKTYKDKTAVNDLNLKMFNDQITVLLGHNGAGKTTTMSMLTGMIPPTDGTAFVRGKDIRTDMVSIRESLGLCPQHNILFDELTVEEHLYFYGRLKGVSINDIQEEILTYLTLIDLKDKRCTQSQNLSGGMKRKLSVCIAFCGDSKVVLLDEPTSGMDPQARRALWDVIQEEKRGRTVLLSTHFMDEADILGDRIAIMGMGVVQCCGSPFFLKKKLGAGYHLICVKDENCESAKVTAVLRQFVSDAAVESDIGTELSYLFLEQDVHKFRDMFEKLESQLAELRLVSFGVSLTTLEEVFLSVGTDPMTKKVDKRPSSMFRTDENESTPMDNVYLRTGMTLVAYQYVALFRKKYLQTIRHWFLLFVQICIPIIFTTITVMSERGRGVFNDLTRLHILPNSFTNVIGVLDTDNEQAAYGAEYRQTAAKIETTSLNFEDYIVKVYARDLFEANNHYIFGATLRSPENMTAWFNNQPYHGAPLALRMLFDAILRKECGADWSINIVNAPRPYTAAERTRMTQFGGDMGFQLAINMDLAMAFVAAFYVLPYIKERICRSKLLQFVSGVRIFTYWAVNLLWDLLTFQMTIIALLVLFIIFNEQGWSSAMEMYRLYIILNFFSWGFLPTTYVFSLFFSEPASGFTRISIIYIVSGMACFFVVFILQLPTYDLSSIGDGLVWFFLVFPHFALSHSLSNINKLGTREALCNIHCAAIPGCDKDTNMCAIIKECCDFKYFAYVDPGIGRNLFYLFLTGIVWFAILFAFEYNLCDYLPGCPSWMSCRRPKPKVVAPITSRTMSSVFHADSDVARENALVQDMEHSEMAQKSLVLKDLHKMYGDFQAVNSLSVAINPYETFGLLGVNGAGKTTTFKMLTGDVSITSGDAWLKGVSHKLNMNTVHKSIGYCPQFDALFEEITGREHLQIYCRLRGIPKENIEQMLNDVAIELNLDKHLDKRSCQYSGGNKRKLSTALALIGHPVVVYLDEPTTGMDPGAKRCLWNVVNNLRKTGKTIILTSHSMDECEALCTRLVIMVNGEFKCIGSVQHLKNKFSRGFSLTLKVKPVFRANSSMEIQAPKPKGIRKRISQFIGKHKSRIHSTDEMRHVSGADDLKVVKIEDAAPNKNISNEEVHFAPRVPRVSMRNQTRDISSASLVVADKRRQSHRLSIVPVRELQLIKEYIADKLPHSELTEEMRGFLTFFIPASNTLKWSHLFGVMEKAKSMFNIEDYSISQTSLEQVFLSFTRQQREE